MGITKELRKQIRDLHFAGYYDWEIARELKISEAIVAMVLYNN